MGCYAARGLPRNQQVVKPFLKKNSCFLPFLGKKNAKNVNKKPQNVYLCDILHVQH